MVNVIAVKKVCQKFVFKCGETVTAIYFVISQHFDQNKWLGSWEFKIMNCTIKNFIEWLSKMKEWKEVPELKKTNWKDSSLRKNYHRWF